MNRRGFLFGLAGLVAAPAIVRVASLMPVRAVGAVWTETDGEAFVLLIEEDIHRALQLAARQAYDVLSRPYYLPPGEIGEWRGALWTDQIVELQG